jgi:hypothetical protein
MSWLAGYLQASVADIAVGRNAADMVIAVVGCGGMLPVSMHQMAVPQLGQG